MRVNKIDFTGSITKAPKRITNPIKNLKKSKMALGMGIAATSGLFMVKMSQNKQNEKTLRELNLNDKIITKILNKKDLSGNNIFDDKSVKVLSEIANLKDKTLYHHIMANIDNVKNVKKELIFADMFSDELIEQYSMFAFTKDGFVSATAIPENDDFFELMEVNERDKTKTITKKLTKENVTYEFIENYKDEKRISIEKISYDNNKNIVTRVLCDGNKEKKEMKQTVFDSKGVIDDKTTVKFIPKSVVTTLTETTNQDFKHNVFSKGKGGDIFSEMTTQTRIYTNPKTGLKEKHTLTPSEVPGVFNSIIIDEKGNKKIESIGKKDKDGNYFAEKNLESFDGTKTHYEYRASKDKNDIKTFYQIKDKDGKALMTSERTFKRVSPKLAYSSVNGHKYEMRRQGTHIIVTDFWDNSKTDIDLKEVCLLPMHVNSSKIFDRMSGDMLLDFYYRGYTYLQKLNINDFGVYPKKRVMAVNDEIFTFSHEQGHTKDFIPNFKTKEFDNVISTNSEVQKAYAEERANFVKNMSHLEKESIDYFINKLDHYMGKHGAEIETVAEINAFLSTDAGASNGVIWSRGYYLQKYFPKTIAAAARLLNPNSNIYLT